MQKFKLPNMEHKFSIQITGEESGINWIGNFVYRRPSLRARSRIEILNKSMNGDMFTIDEDIRAYNEAISHLRHTLIETPDWWKEADFGGELYDANVVLEIMDKCMKFEASWREKVHGGEPQKVEASSVSASEPSVPAAGQVAQ